jgi:hypothetical protein
VRTILLGDQRAGAKLQEIDERIRKTGRPMPRPVTGPIEGFYAQGSLGQCLAVIPRHRIVAVRHLRSPQNQKIKTYEFPEFIRMARELVPAKR